MADRKISELSALTGANSADDDVLVIVDTSADETKKITLGELENALAERDFSFGDNDKLVFGAGSDLQIYHDGSHSQIRDVGTGNLYIKATSGVLIQDNDTGTNRLTTSSSGPVYLYHSGNLKLATTSTGIDVTGTVTADGLTVDTNTLYVDATNNRVGIGTTTPSRDLTISSTSPQISLEDTNASGTPYSKISGASGNIYIQADEGNETANSKIDFRVDGLQRAVIDNNGDISFYEDTGTTAKFFWDASAERLGIGTTSPTTPLAVHSDAGVVIKIDGDTANTSRTLLFRSVGTGEGIVQTDGNMHFLQEDASRYMRFSTANTERMRIDSSGNVGIGTSSPSQILHVEASGTNPYIRVTETGNTGIDFGQETNGNGLINLRDSADLRVFTGSTERMRIDSSGNLLVGKTSINFNADGTEIKAGGELYVTQTNAHPVQLNRLSSDGDIAKFYKDGTTVGSIGTYGGYISVGSGDVYVLYNSTANALLPASTATAGTSDGAIDLGSSSRRFKDLYLSGGVYEGSSNVGTKVKTGSSSVSFTLSCNPQGSLWRHGYILITCSAGSNASTSADTIYALYDVQADLTNSYPVSLTFKDHIGTSMTDFSISLSSGVLTVADNSATWDNMICRVEFGVFTGNVGIT